MTFSRFPSLVLLFAVAIVGILPPTLTRAEDKRPVKVFVLAGQSNMQGKAAVSTLDAVINDPKTHDQFKHLKPDGKWLVRDDVWVTYLDRSDRGRPLPLHGPLTVGFGSPKTGRDENFKKVPVKAIGPELGIGHVLGDHYDEPVLLIKAAWGGRAVKYTFRPPSAIPSDEQIKEEVAALRQRKPDTEVTFESYKEGYGRDYRNILSEPRRYSATSRNTSPITTNPRGSRLPASSGSRAGTTASARAIPIIRSRWPASSATSART